jgi:hypothetical protein
MVEYLKINDWEKWQSYRKDRGQPPWIKIHRRVMRNPKWVSLTDAERGQLVAMWLLAADHDGVILASPDMIQKLCYMSKPPDLNKFTDLGFIENGWRQHDVNLASDGRQHDAPDKIRVETDKIREDKKHIIPSRSVGEFQNVFLTEEEMDKLNQTLGIEQTKKAIESLSGYMASKGKKYKSHYATILNWERKNQGAKVQKHSGLQEWLTKQEDKYGPEEG